MMSFLKLKMSKTDVQLQLHMPLKAIWFALNSRKIKPFQVLNQFMELLYSENLMGLVSANLKEKPCYIVNASF